MATFLCTLAQKRDIEKVPDDCKNNTLQFAKDEGVDFIAWSELGDSHPLREKLFLGNRDCLETVLMRSNGRKLEDFADLPETARWKIREVDGEQVPSLEDRNHIYCMMPNSGTISQIFKNLSIPDPDHIGPKGFPVPRDFCEDVWFEECEAGGVYVLGIYDFICIMYLDVSSDATAVVEVGTVQHKGSKGGKLHGMYKCTRAEWKTKWLNTFGSLLVDVTTMEKRYIEKVHGKGFDGDNSCRFASTSDSGVTYSEWCDLSDGDIGLKEKLYLGNRNCLETILMRNNRRKFEDFAELPETAIWKLRDIGGFPTPSLEDKSKVFVLMPDSSKVSKIFKTLSMPDPDKSGPAGYPIPRDFCEDVWFEECDDGGVYIIGIEDTVFIMYIDVSVDKLYGMFKCSRARWKSTWLGTFGSLTVDPSTFE